MAPDPVIQRQLDALWERHGDALHLLSEPCRGRELPATGNLPVGFTQGCGGQCVVEYHYFNEEERLQKVKLCAVCDRVYEFPRFV